MSIKIEQSTGAMSGTADRDYFLDDAGEVTTDETAAATLLIRKGQEIPKEMADRYGIGQGKKTAQAEEVDGGEKASGPSANKAVKPAKNKGA